MMNCAKDCDKHKAEGRAFTCGGGRPLPRCPWCGQTHAGKYLLCDTCEQEAIRRKERTK